MKYEISINYIQFGVDSMIIGWSAKDIGFGQLTVYIGKDEDVGKFVFDTECMSNDFRDQVLKEAIDYIISNNA